MLKVEVNKNKNNGFCMVEANGPLPEIVGDLLMVIGSIGGSLDKKTHTLGKLYEDMLKAALDDGVALKSPDSDNVVDAVGTGKGVDEALKDMIDNLKRKAGF